MRCLSYCLTSKFKSFLFSSQKPNFCFTNFKRHNHLCTFVQASPYSSLVLAKDPIAIAEALSFSLNSNSSALGTQIHGYVIKLGFDNDVFTENNLIRMYTKSGRLPDGVKVFDDMCKRNVVSWALLISGAVHCWEPELALEIYVGMTRTGLMPNEFVFGSVLKGCTTMEIRGFGVSIHCWALKVGFESNPYVGSSMLSFYCKMEDLEAAERIFESMEKVDVGCWNAILGGYARYGYGRKALRIASSMRSQGLNFDQYTFISSLQGSSLVPDLYFGRQVHALILRTGAACCTSVMNAVMDMYTKNDEVHCALKVFGEMVDRDIVTWNTAFGSLAAHYEGTREIVNLFRNFMLTGMSPNRITFSLLFRQCGELVDVKLGLQFCSLVIHFGLFDEVIVSSSLVNMFSRCGFMQMASLVADTISSKDTVIWNELISGYNFNGQFIEALLTFRNLEKAGVQADEYTYSHILETCCKYGCQKMIQQIHGAVIKAGFASHGYCCSSFIKGYAKLGLLHESSKIFDRCERIDLATWGTMISALLHHGQEQEAVRCFRSLLESGEKPDEFILASILGSCGSRGTYDGIKAAQPFVTKLGYETDVFVSSAMLDAYAKCGDIKSARAVFDQSSRFHDVALYNAMMTACAHHGLGLEALEMFEKMKSANLQPNQVTFVSIISACGHLGMIDRGCSLFESMLLEHGLEPSPDNYGCLVDMLSKTGRLEDARRVIETMPFPPWPAVLRALLSGCRIHGNKEVGEWAAVKLVHLVPRNDATYALWLKVHSESGNWEEAANINDTVSEMKLRKHAGQSWIEVNHG